MIASMYAFVVAFGILCQSFASFQLASDEPKKHGAGLMVMHVKNRTGSSTKVLTQFWPGTVPSGMPDSTPGVEYYGPKDCVSTYRSTEGHCIIQTRCKDVDTAKHEFGVICVDKDKSPVRHYFGKNSFDPEETFDTLIKCEQCLGLDEIPADISLNGNLAHMSNEIKAIAKDMKKIGATVKKLNAKVFPPSPAPAPGPAPAGAAKPKKAKFLVHPRVKQHQHEHQLQQSVPVDAEGMVVESGDHSTQPRKVEKLSHVLPAAPPHKRPAEKVTKVQDTNEHLKHDTHQHRKKAVVYAR
jgi:hypothetical protein